MTEVNVTSLKKIKIYQFCVDEIHEFILKECEKYPLKKNPKPVTILAKVIKLYGANFLKMTQNKKFPV